MKEFFQIFDQAKTKIHKQKTYSTSLGKCLGFIAFISLVLAFMYKFYLMISKSQIQLSSYYAYDRSPIDIRDLDLRLEIYGQVPITFNNQFQYGLNVTMVEYIKISKQTIIKQKQKKNIQAKRYEERQFSMVSCLDDPEQFCPSPEILQNMTIQGDSYFQDDLVIYYQVQILPCDKNNLLCKPPSIDGYLLLYTFLCRKFNVYEKQTEQILSDCKAPTKNVILLDFSGNISEIITSKLRQVNITTVQPKIIPSIVPYILQTESQKSKFQEFWCLDEMTNDNQNRFYQDSPYLIIKFARSWRSQSYQRNFVGIDNVLAEIFGISAFVTIVLKIILDGFTKWEAQCYLASQTSEDAKFNGSFIKYVKQKIICCCSRQKYREQAQKRKQLVKQAYGHVDVVEANRKFKEMEQRIKQLQKLLNFKENLTEQRVQTEQFTEEKEYRKQIILNQTIKQTFVVNEHKKSELKDSIQYPLLSS